MASSTALSVAFMRASSRWQRRRVFQTDSRDLGALVVSLVAILCQLAWPEYNPLRRSRQPPLAPGASTIPTVLPTVPIARAGSRTTGPPHFGRCWRPPTAASRLLLGHYARPVKGPRARAQGWADPMAAPRVVPNGRPKPRPEQGVGACRGLHPGLAGGGS